jgi:hypothetical protein
MLLCTEVEAQQATAGQTAKQFVGYKAGNACYYDYETHKLLSIGEGTQQYLLPSGCQVYFISDSTICYTSRLDNGYLLVWVYKADTIKAILPNEPMQVYGNGNSVYYNASGGEKIYKLDRDGKVTDTNWIAQVIGLSDKYLYYSIEDAASETVAASIYKLDLRTDVQTKIADNVLGDVATIFNDKYLYTYKLKQGECKPLLINIGNDKLTYLDIEDRYIDITPYLSPNGEHLIFYNAITLQKYIYILPK